jgi:hypothetical protein
MTSPAPCRPSSSSPSSSFPTSNQPRSWAEALQQYSDLKHRAPSAPLQPPPSRHLPLSHPIHRNSRNVVTSRYWDESREQQEADDERRQRQSPGQRRLSTAPAAQSRAARRDFDIVSNVCRAGDGAASACVASSSPPSLPPSASARHHDLISHHLLYPTSASVLSALDSAEYNRLLNRSRVKHSREAREYDIIGHRQKGDEQEAQRRQQEEKEALRDELRRRYHDTHHYDLLVGQFYDPERERAWRRRRRQLQQQG